MAVTDGWSERTWRSAGRRRPQRAQRSLKAALFEAGLVETPTGSYDERDEVESSSGAGFPPTAAPDYDAVYSEDVRPPLASPRIAYFAEQVKASGAARPVQAEGVVSPPPWVRAARRRWHSRLLNAFGWTMAIIVAGSIVGVAGRYLAVPPVGLETMATARQ